MFHVEQARPVGPWQCYAKRLGHWISIGEPTSRAQAEELVLTMQEEGRLEQPHCVPL
jgi:hypothetical protein